MSLETLLAAVQAEAEARREEILESARDEAARILERARAQAEERRAEHRARLEEEARAEVLGRLSDARRAGRQRVLAARTGGLERVFDAVRSRLPDATADDAYRTVLPGVLAAALEHVEGGEVVIRCSPGLAGALREALASEVAGSDREAEGRSVKVEEDPEADAGFLLGVPDRGFEVDATLAAAVRRLRPGLVIDLVERVEGVPEPPGVLDPEEDDGPGVPSHLTGEGDP